MKLPGFSRELNPAQARPKSKTKPPIKLKAAELPSLARAKIQAMRSTANEAMKRNRLSLRTPMTKSVIAATNGIDWKTVSMRVEWSTKMLTEAPPKALN